ncbi:galactose-binding domain-containing protein [bacterium endosymbiont of Bathymodiolus sp. 5 South]|uniref:galactose-binding domain-containing protein n=1 Tax=bacterium endosymbiont of Bathymodiolus sp. 5 South TaxID=1181670 RepID=UPI0010BB9710|nr:discoidin domain-containing protein [bacterium endosymbiont of Bathymodiolus sp. 5 South]SHN93474.1 hypothetical protein BCLUESOX_660 [bacterium endosymbiont of Bathymodiolus sp. 5 South]
MKNTTNTLNKLTKLLAVAIISVSLNAFSVTISTNYVSATAGTAITPVTITNTGDAAFYYSISPAISNGLSFNARNGTISGTPIFTSDPVTYVITTYVVTATGLFIKDTATVVIAVGVGDINLAFGKHATQSSTHLYRSIVPVAGYAVDGNTDGHFLNKSTTYTEYEHGAWWQVDLGSKKNINQIIIYNRTDCCADRLSNYQVSISDKADFSTHIYQQDFHVAPNPKKTIKLDASGKQGRYVRIQLLDQNYLSLAEVQVMGIDPLRFAKVDYSSTHNDFDGSYNAPNYANKTAFAAVKSDGSIIAWGGLPSEGIDPDSVGKNAPTDSGYTEIYSNEYAFAALKADGSITTWGSLNNGGTNASNVPTDKGYTKIYSTVSAFAALAHDGSIKVWGNSDYGGANAPAGSGYTKIYSTVGAFAVLKADGSIKAWGESDAGGVNAPADKGYTKIYSNEHAFAALKADGSIKAWGDPFTGGESAPADKGYTKIYSNEFAFAALKADGSITVWGNSFSGGTSAPTDKGYTKIYSNEYAFAALKADGSITTWGDTKSGGKNALNAPTDKDYIKVYSTRRAFAALKADGSITTWGDMENPWSNIENIRKNIPTDKGYIEIYSNEFAFTAVRPDGSIRTWGDPSYGGAYASGGYNLALGKPATQSSIYPHRIHAVAGYAVDGNTDGEFLNSSTTHTQKEQGAWWQVDLGSKKSIDQIIIYNRTDCCANRLSNYQVSISNKADFSTHTYQQDFHVAPNPKKTIKLGAPSKKGRYVRIQLLDKNYLSLAEVQVIGVDL